METKEETYEHTIKQAILNQDKSLSKLLDGYTNKRDIVALKNKRCLTRKQLSKYLFSLKIWLLQGRLDKNYYGSVSENTRSLVRSLPT